MVEQYVQELDVQVSAKHKRMQWAGIFLVLFSLGFLMLAIFLSWFFLIGFALIFAVGIEFIHIYNNVKKEYVYEFNPKRLTIVGKDVVNRQKRLLTLLFKDVESFEIMQDEYDEKCDLLYCQNAYDKGVWQIVFTLDGVKRRLLFAPDEYMVALIRETMQQNNKLDG